MTKPKPSKRPDPTTGILVVALRGGLVRHAHHDRYAVLAGTRGRLLRITSALSAVDSHTGWGVVVFDRLLKHGASAVWFTAPREVEVPLNWLRWHSNPSPYDVALGRR